MTTIHTLPLRPAEAPAPAEARPANRAVADALDHAAALLEERGANEHRVGAYRRAAETVRALDANVAEMVHAGGPAALETLPNVGESLSQRIAAFVHTGELALVRELREAMPPERVFRRLDGVGPELARRIHDALGVDTLEALEIAAYDGRLEAVPGVGAGRIRSLRAQLDAILSPQTRRDARGARNVRPLRPLDVPSVADLVNVDDEYRYRASRGDLPTIAPRRFNAAGEAWLPVMETRRGPWRFTALFSNTPRAHELGKTGDWVVLYFSGPDGRERQCTVVTETRGDLRGRRVVRGRERECADLYGYERRAA